MENNPPLPDQVTTEEMLIVVCGHIVYNACSTRGNPEAAR